MPNYHRPQPLPGQLVLMFDKKTLGIVTAVFKARGPEDLNGDAATYELYHVMWMDTPTQRIQSVTTWNPYGWIDELIS